MRARVEKGDVLIWNKSKGHISEVRFLWFIGIVRYLQLLTGETVLTDESQRDEFSEANDRNNKEQYIVISAFKKYVPPTMGGFGEGKESATPLKAIISTEWCNVNGGVRRVFLRASKYLQYHRIKLQSGINREFQIHMEAQLLASKLLGKCGVFWYQLYADI